MTKKVLALLLAIVMLLAMVPLGASAATVNFTDVKTTDYFYAPVQWAVENTITSGTSPTTFSPNKTCTRAEAVMFLWTLAERPEPITDQNPFKDVKSTDYYYKAVLWAVTHGITAGTSTSTFGPNQNCTRGQIVTFIYKFFNPQDATSANPFKDVPANQYYYKPVLWAAKENITAGTSATTFGPNDACTRGQIMTFLYKASVKPAPGSEDKLTAGSMSLLSAVDLVYSQNGERLLNRLSVYNYSVERQIYEIDRMTLPVGENGQYVYDEMLVSPSGQVLLQVDGKETFYSTINGYASIAFIKAGTDEVISEDSDIVMSHTRQPLEDGTTWVSYQYNDPKGAYDVRLTTYDKTGKKVKSFLMSEKELNDWYSSIKDHPDSMSVQSFVARRYGADFGIYTAPQDISDPGRKQVNGSFVTDPQTGRYVSDNTLGVVVTDTATGFTVKSKEGKLLGEIVIKNKDKNTYVTVAGNTLLVLEDHSITFAGETSHDDCILRAYHLTV